MVQTLDLAPLEAETLLQALRSVVHDHFGVEGSGASVVDIDNVDPGIASAPETEFRESTRSANECFGEEDVDDWAPPAVEEGRTRLRSHDSHLRFYMTRGLGFE